MTLDTACAACGQKYRLPAALAGKKAKCKSCGEFMTIPLPAVEPVPPSPPKVAAKPARRPLQSFGAQATPRDRPPLQSFGAAAAPPPPRAAQPLDDFDELDDDADPYGFAASPAPPPKPSADIDEDELPATRRPGRVKPSKAKRSYRPAGLFRRWVAAMIDRVLLVILYVVTLVAVFWFAASTRNMPETVMGIIALAVLPYFVIGIVYFGLLTASTSQATVGKSLMGLKVTDHDGRRLSPYKSFLRAGVSISFEFVPLLALINVLMAITSDMGWTLYDRVAQTQVVEAG